MDSLATAHSKALVLEVRSHVDKIVFPWHKKTKLQYCLLSIGGTGQNHGFVLLIYAVLYHSILLVGSADAAPPMLLSHRTV